MRGEDAGTARAFTEELETPPHAWGRLSLASTSRSRARNTPTCVGKTATRQPPQRMKQKHPHMRGEDMIETGKVSLSSETPPHAWGRQFMKPLLPLLQRNTPTCVGKTVPAHFPAPCRQKHPHMRGEDLIASVAVPPNMETPPHAWGRLPSVSPDPAVRRNTPTCVGKTEFGVNRTGVVRKHPHMRGEDSCFPDRHLPTPETPPHAWGRLDAICRTNLHQRNTPTCVGKTLQGPPSISSVQKHPHMRGEDPERSLNFFLHTWY